MDFELNILDNLTLKEAYSNFQGDPPSSIPFLVWLLENPDSPLALPGNIYLREHDYLHLILGCDRSSTGEAFVIGFTMGNDSSTNWLHLAIFKFFARFLYPKKYQFKREDFKYFNLGFNYGKKLGVEHINQINKFLMDDWLNNSLEEIRDFLGINSEEIKLLFNKTTYESSF